MKTNGEQFLQRFIKSLNCFCFSESTVVRVQLFGILKKEKENNKTKKH